jgi:hypothetical protein
VRPEQQKRTELAMAERLTKLTTKTQSKRLKATLWTPSYAHMSSACEREISIERDSGIGVESQYRRNMSRIGDETILKSFDEEPEEEDLAMTWKLTSLTRSYAHVVSPCSRDSSILMRFFRANARGLPERTES